jgi:hypothetical protein
MKTRTLKAYLSIFILTFPGFGYPAILDGTGSFDGTESTMSPRFFRSGSPGGPCGPFSSGNFQYQAIDFKTDSSGQLSATFDPQTLGTSIFVTFHTGIFDPSNICTGYVWSYGSSALFSETFAAPPNTDMVMVVSGVANAPNVVGGPYSYELDGVSLTPIQTTKIPTLSEWAKITLALMLLVPAGWYWGRRQG